MWNSYAVFIVTSWCLTEMDYFSRSQMPNSTEYRNTKHSRIYGQQTIPYRFCFIRIQNVSCYSAVDIIVVSIRHAVEIRHLQWIEFRLPTHFDDFFYSC